MEIVSFVNCFLINVSLCFVLVSFPMLRIRSDSDTVVMHQSLNTNTVTKSPLWLHKLFI